jgi:hypothetical protein
MRRRTIHAGGPDLTEEEVVILRCSASDNHVLSLKGLQIKDASLAAIPETVRMLILTDVPISDDGVRHLVRLQSLRNVSLAGTKITDAGLELLAFLQQLEELDISRTNVTNQGISKLKAKLQNTIIRS